MDFDEIYKHVTEDYDFHIYLVDEATQKREHLPQRISEGMAYAFAKDADFKREAVAAYDRFLSTDYGDMYEWDEYPIAGREEGNYPSKYGDIRVKREGVPPYIVLFFPFER